MTRADARTVAINHARVFVHCSAQRYAPRAVLTTTTHVRRNNSSGQKLNSRARTKLAKLITIFVA